jgi:hypothetical protein
MAYHSFKSRMGMARSFYLTNSRALLRVSFRAEHCDHLPHPASLSFSIELLASLAQLTCDMIFSTR